MRQAEAFDTVARWEPATYDSQRYAVAMAVLGLAEARRLRSIGMVGAARSQRDLAGCYRAEAQRMSLHPVLRSVPAQDVAWYAHTRRDTFAAHFHASTY
jgi:hypothetical protein